MSQASIGWQGILNLNYCHEHQTTKLMTAYSQAPLKVQRSFYPEGQDICHNIILHTAGGIVGGDRLSQQIQLQPHAKALLTTASATKIYRSNGHPAEQQIRIQVKDRGYCEFLPREAILFNGAIYRQNLQVELAETARFFTWEITRLGRSARGEEFCQGDWRSCTTVRQNGQLIWVDRQWLPGDPNVIHSPHGLAGKPLVGTLCWVGAPVNQATITAIRDLWMPHTAGEIGVTQLISGLVCRCRGHSTREVIDWFTKVWQLLRGQNLGRTAVLPRVWAL
ncbi:MAG: urease accessory protein UreD [Oscillatoriales cyanobacterium RM2_1_1]|nr:urease accessory protein UreD [Oscillatoriales cyanobacterium RM2_1_1]